MKRESLLRRRRSRHHHHHHHHSPSFRVRCCPSGLLPRINAPARARASPAALLFFVSRRRHPPQSVNNEITAEDEKNFGRLILTSPPLYPCFLGRFLIRNVFAI